MTKDKMGYPKQQSSNPVVEPLVGGPSAPPEGALMYPLLDPNPGAPPPYTENNYQSAPAPQQQPPITIQPTHTTVYVTQVQRPIFPAKPINIQCWYCQQNIRTRTKGHSTCLTWLLCGILCGIGCFCGCCLIPFCTNGTRDIVHSCPKCGKYLGTKQRVS